jgi:hypothetical protein
MHNFSLVGEVFLYFILRVEVVEIQISLPIINRFGKRKGNFNSILAVGRNPARNRVRPSQPCVETPINSTTDNSNFAQD